ncbi:MULTISPECIES: helix-turn-helix domain-containing protein [Thermonema]|uniref:AlbA family DNA-binding domain-containing protein n=1 Tax=Thermonema TaxID=28194 RepID=UPI00056F67BD|nr:MULTISPECIES: ATP-binding protein [Thermonema]
MEWQELKRLVRQGEGLHLEFKLKSSHPEKIIKEMIAFANTEGGILIVGVSDDLKIKGVKFPDEELYVLRRAIQKHIQPALEYRLDVLQVEDRKEREVLIFNIPKSPTLLYFIDESGSKKVYVRVNDKTIQASKEMRVILREKRKNKSFRFRYGTKEQLLMRHLAEHGHINVSTFAEVAGITRRMASRTLTLLVLANVLTILPQEQGEDLFRALDPEEAHSQTAFNK